CRESVERTSRVFKFDWENNSLVEPLTPFGKLHNYYLSKVSRAGNYIVAHKDYNKEPFISVYEVYDKNKNIIIDNLGNFFDLQKYNLISVLVYPRFRLATVLYVLVVLHFLVLAIGG
ncbi:MAG: hypothetical protein ACE5F1_14760, partial [Planctomycetota bacterium]